MTASPYGDCLRRRRGFASLLICLTSVACGGGGSSEPPPPPPVGTVTVASPTLGQLALGAQLQLVVTVRDPAGNPIADPSVTWASSNAAAATVSATGLVTALASGDANISATSDGKSGSLALEVRGAPATLLLPDTVHVSQGESVIPSVEVLDAAGNEVSGVPVVYVSSDPSRVAVVGTSLSAIGKAGSVAVTATAGPAGTSTVATVAQVAAQLSVDQSRLGLVPGAAGSCGVELLDRAGDPMPLAQGALTSTNPAAMTVEAAGVCRGVATGSARLRVQFLGQDKTRAVDVRMATHPAGSTVTPIAMYADGAAWQADALDDATAFVALAGGANAFSAVHTLNLSQMTRADSARTQFSPFGLVVDPAERKVYATINTIGVRQYNADALGTQTDLMSAGTPGFVEGLMLGNDGATLFAANSNGYVLRYRPGVAAPDLLSLLSAPGLKFLTPHPTQPLLYVSGSPAGGVYEVNVTTFQLVRRLAPTLNAGQSVVSPDGTEVYVADQSGSLVVWNLTTDQLVQAVPLGATPFGIGMTRDGQHLYLTLSATGDVVVFDRTTRAEVRRITLPDNPSFVSFDYTGGTAIVSGELAVYLIR